MNAVVQNLRLAIYRLGYQVRPYFILKPTPNDIATHQKEYQDRVNYEPTGCTDFDKEHTILSAEVICNYDKHLDAWRRISELSIGSNDICMVMEDDTFMISQSSSTFGELISLAIEDMSVWDIVFMTVSHGNHEGPVTFQNTLDHFKIVPSKTTYLINKKAAAELLVSLRAPIKFSLRVQLSWYLSNNSSLRVVNPNRTAIIDGSKCGFYPSSIHDKNVLIYNSEYMKLLSLLRETDDIIKENIEKIHTIYKSVAHLESPDIMHVYGLLLFRAGQAPKAQTILCDAVDVTKKKKGLLTVKNELLNNLIDTYKYTQSDIEHVKTLKSKYFGASQPQ